MRENLITYCYQQYNAPLQQKLHYCIIMSNNATMMHKRSRIAQKKKLYKFIVEVDNTYLLSMIPFKRWPPFASHLSDVFAITIRWVYTNNFDFCKARICFYIDSNNFDDSSITSCSYCVMFPLIHLSFKFGVRIPLSGFTGMY